MIELSLEQCFETLKIQNGDSFDVARKAYKQQMHRLHPDRFPQDPSAQSRAAEQFLQVKRCFQKIEEHYMLFGDMPLLETTLDEEPVLEPDPDLEFKQHSAKMNKREKELLKNASAVNTDGGHLHDATLNSQHHKSKSNSPGELGAGLFIIGILAYFILVPPTEKFWEQESSEAYDPSRSLLQDQHPQSNMKPSHKGDGKNIGTNTSKPAKGAHDFLSEEEFKAKALLSKTQQRLLETQSGRSFTFGSSYKDVAAIHGAPDKSEKNTWFYDKSSVIFRNGKVVDWKSDPSTPLATRLK